MPPPNVTGKLHMGHALNMTTQDIITRMRRMQGYETLWLPGTDHAGIATQAVVEKRLAEQGITRHDLGREEFVRRVWQWKDEYHATIVGQLESLGASCDWSRERFTFDENLSKAVREVFVTLYEQGLIYRGEYIVNWCPRCSTALSDIEVEHEDEHGHLWSLRYPFADGSGSLVVATTRPETMLGDTAVAVHPEDSRYTDAVGKMIRLPLTGRLIPVVADAYVDREFGTGAVKVTPAHDPNDFAIAGRHNLPSIKVIGLDGAMTEAAGKYAGLDRYACREAVLKDLEAEGSLVEIKAHDHAVGHCERCHTVVEPLVSRQWFVKMGPLAEPAIEAVKSGDITFVPDRMAKIYLNWVENVHDWCISRQIWWGHRIPAWYCQDCGETVVTRHDPETCPKCGGKHLAQDEDVLDTWFSSALWPFSTLGWPEKTPDLSKFYPTSVLVTAYDIIYFWVARMIFQGLHFTGQRPFDKVLIHGLIRDAEGRKMSKSLGNGVDPIDVINDYGADALRLTLVTGNTPGNDLRYYPEKVEASRNFLTKLWNASRFVLMNLEGLELDGKLPPASDLELPDRWILARLSGVLSEATRLMERYEFAEASRILYDFTWGEFCDWYIEMTKVRLYGEDQPKKLVAASVLHYVLAQILKAWHPYLPFITEEIWQAARLPGEAENVIIAEWPELEMQDDEALAEMDRIMEAVRSIRNLRAEMNVPPSRKADIIIMPANGIARQTFGHGADLITALALGKTVRLIQSDAERPAKSAALAVSGGQIFLPLSDLIDIAAERDRLAKEQARLQSEVDRASRKLSNEGFRKSAPAAVVAEEERKLADYRSKLAATMERLEEIESNS
jgi:valyl-tRNA synthetase